MSKIYLSPYESPLFKKKETIVLYRRKIGKSEPYVWIWFDKACIAYFSLAGYSPTIEEAAEQLDNWLLRQNKYVLLSKERFEKLEILA